MPAFDTITQTRTLQYKIFQNWLKSCKMPKTALLLKKILELVTTDNTCKED